MLSRKRRKSSPVDEDIMFPNFYLDSPSSDMRVSKLPTVLGQKHIVRMRFKGKIWIILIKCVKFEYFPLST